MRQNKKQRIHCIVSLMLVICVSTYAMAKDYTVDLRPKFPPLRNQWQANQCVAYSLSAVITAKTGRLVEPGLLYSESTSGQNPVEAFNIAIRKGFFTSYTFVDGLDNIKKALEKGDPLIVDYKLETGLYHTVVIVGYRGDILLLRDSRGGHYREISYKEFAPKIWEVYILGGWK